MHALTSIIEDIIRKIDIHHLISGVAIYPVNQDGRQVSCFKTMDINNAELYEYNILKKDGNFFLINCWNSPLHCHPHSRLRNIAPAPNAVYKCECCDFCLFDSAGYNLYLILPNETTQVNFKSMAETIQEQLNAPICNITLHYEDTGGNRSIALNEPIYERREKPCVKPKARNGIFRKTKNKKDIAKWPKGRL